MLKSENTMQEDEMLVFEEEHLQQITEEQRHQIIILAKFLKLNLNGLEFRRTGIRYKYWNNAKKLTELINDNVIPCEHDFFEDSDCGNLYFVKYNGYEDNEFPNSSHNIRYKVKYEKKTIT